MNEEVYFNKLLKDINVSTYNLITRAPDTARFISLDKYNSIYKLYKNKIIHYE